MSEETESEGIIAKITGTIEQNWRLLLVGVIILIIALNSSWSNNESSVENNNESTPSTQAEQSNPSEQNKNENNAQADDNNTNDNAQTKEPETTNTVSNGNSIVQIAAKSEGITHLARRAVKEYLGSTQENLSAEQKIYVEDYLKRKIGSRLLEVGEKIEFSTDLIKQGAEEAKGLNQKQIENLSKYVPLVKNLN